MYLFPRKEAPNAMMPHFQDIPIDRSPTPALGSDESRTRALVKTSFKSEQSPPFINGYHTCIHTSLGTNET